MEGRDGALVIWPNTAHDTALRAIMGLIIVQIQAVRWYHLYLPWPRRAGL